MDMKNKSFKFYLLCIFLFIERRIASHCQIVWLRFGDGLEFNLFELVSDI